MPATGVAGYCQDNDMDYFARGVLLVSSQDMYDNPRAEADAQVHPDIAEYRIPP
jgi:hypothetical protein